MGGDGGSIPRRIELVRTKKKLERLERDIEAAARWKLCALSQQSLREPIVACRLGRLYNKEALIEALLNKTIAENENSKHIRSLKDVKELCLTLNPAFDSSKIDKGYQYKDYNMAEFICPVVGLEMNGKYRFGVVWSCGCVVSEKAIKEVESDVCHKCGKAWSKEDVVPINGTEEEMEELGKRLEEEREMEKLAKKKRKMQNTRAEGGRPEKRKAGQETNKSKGSTVQTDTASSSVYKSLFTTCEAAKKQPKAHWVTYNPQYY